MQVSERDVHNRYLEVLGTYNATPLAVRDGWVQHPTNFGLIEVGTVARYLPEAGVLLDIGTGKGIVPRFAQTLGARVVSVDSLGAAGGSAIENVRQAGIEGHFCDILREPLPLEDAAADCVFFGDVIEHLLHSPKSALLEIRRVLKPGGVCIATTPNAMRLTVRLRVAAGFSNWGRIDEYFDGDFHAGHHHEYTIEEFRGVFTRTGFEVAEFILYEDSLRTARLLGVDDLKTQGRSRVPPGREAFYVSAGKRLLLGVTGLLPRLRSNMLLVAKKPVENPRGDTVGPQSRT